MVDIVAMDVEGREVAKGVILDHIRCAFQRPRRVIVELDGDEYKVTVECDQQVIARTRRITGYLSDLSHFGSAKAAEEGDRRPHR